MSGTAGIGTLFAAAVTATGAQLDANYDTLVVYLNDPTNRNNYGQGGAVTNTVAVTFVPPVVGGYTAGLELTWKWGTLNTGAVVLNANGLGSISLVNPDGTALQAGQGLAGSIGKAVYDGTRAIFLAPPSPASKAAMQTATASATFVTPAQMVNHPGVAKAWAVVDGTATGTVLTTFGYGITQHVRAGTGTYVFSMTTPLANANYAVLSTNRSGGAAAIVQEAGRSSATFTVVSANLSATAQDCNTFHVAIFGTS